jgi:hypothetical protein
MFPSLPRYILNDWKRTPVINILCITVVAGIAAGLKGDWHQFFYSCIWSSLGVHMGMVIDWFRQRSHYRKTHSVEA